MTPEAIATIACIVTLGLLFAKDARARAKHNREFKARIDAFDKKVREWKP